MKRLGVVGAGQMGGGIAHAAALAGYEVLLFDVAAARLETALTAIDRNLRRQPTRERSNRRRSPQRWRGSRRR